MLHFAYGANMHRAVMRKHAPLAQPLGPARLADHRFVIAADGYASVEPGPAHVVHGVLWRLTPRDRVTLDAWENVAGGLYLPETIAVLRNGRHCPALVYIARPRAAGRPKSGYMEIVIAAAREWKFPADYLVALQQWLSPHALGGGTRKLGEFDWK